jgi:hypothetical protein
VAGPRWVVLCCPRRGIASARVEGRPDDLRHPATAPLSGPVSLPQPSPLTCEPCSKGVYSVARLQAKHDEIPNRQICADFAGIDCPKHHSVRAQRPRVHSNQRQKGGDALAGDSRVRRISRGLSCCSICRDAIGEVGGVECLVFGQRTIDISARVGLEL